MAKKKVLKKETPLGENVRLLKCGAWGYILNGKPVFKSINVETVNLFSKWATETVLKEASRMQILEGETKVLPKCHLCDNGTWRVEGNNFESQTKIPK